MMSGAYHVALLTGNAGSSYHRSAVPALKSKPADRLQVHLHVGGACFKPVLRPHHKTFSCAPGMLACVSRSRTQLTTTNEYLPVGFFGSLPGMFGGVRLLMPMQRGCEDLLDAFACTLQQHNPCQGHTAEVQLSAPGIPIRSSCRAQGR